MFQLDFLAPPCGGNITTGAHGHIITTEHTANVTYTHALKEEHRAAYFIQTVEHFVLAPHHVYK